MDIFSHDLLTTAEAAKIMGLKVNTLEIWRVRGTGPTHVKLGDGIRAPVRYRRSELMDWIEKHHFASTSASSVAGTRNRPRPVEVVNVPCAPNAPWLKSNA
ncbi:MAG: helix-turn-helix domain-containing protein [Exiguobacterium profundum]|nr:MAG: helix-turn-helix domain-containing protein [Exiguobacterium profundum]